MTKAISDVPARDAANIDTPESAVKLSRIRGVDVARGLALLWMFVSHFGPAPDGGSISSLFVQSAYGRSQALFVLLAGVSIALLSGGPNPPRGQAAQRATIRIAVRAILLAPLGIVLTALDTGIDVILTFYALFFLLAIPAIRLRTRSLVVLAATLTLLGGVASFIIRARFWPVEWSTDLNAGGIDFSNFSSPHGLAVLFLLGYYPAFTVMPFILTGMAIGRLDLRRPMMAWRVLAVGAVLAVVGYGGSWLALHPLGGLQRILASIPADNRASAARQLYNGVDGFVPTTTPAWLLTSAPYTGTAFWIAGAGGIALMLLGGCLVLTRRIKAHGPVIGQLANLGTFVLTAYALHIIVAAILPDIDSDAGAWLELAAVSAVSVLFVELWRRWVSKRGPLETLLHECSTKTAEVILRDGRGRRPEHPARATLPQPDNG